MSNYKSVSFLGTSISNGYFDEDGSGGWVARLFKKLNTDKPGGYYLCNLARSGDRSYDYWHRLCGEAIPRQTDVLMIEVSCNDVIRFHKPNAPIIMSIEVQEELWINILTTAKKNFGEIYVFSGFPVNETHMPAIVYNDWPYYNFNSDMIVTNTLIEKLCKGHNIPYIDQFSDLNVPAYLDNLPDGSHPNSTGHEFAATIAHKKLKALGF